MKNDKYRGAKIICIIASFFYIIVAVLALKGAEMKKISFETGDLFGGYGSLFFGGRKGNSEGNDISIDYGGLTEESTEISEEETDEPEKAADADTQEGKEQKSDEAASSREKAEEAGDAAASQEEAQEMEDAQSSGDAEADASKEETENTDDADSVTDETGNTDEGVPSEGTADAAGEAEADAVTEDESAKADEYYSFTVQTGGTSRLNMRIAPDIGAQVITRLNPGDTGYVLEIGDDWSKVVSGSFTGYCSNSSLNMKPVSKEEYEEGTKAQP